MQVPTSKLPQGDGPKAMPVQQSVLGSATTAMGCFLKYVVDNSIVPTFSLP